MAKFPAVLLPTDVKPIHDRCEAFSGFCCTNPIDSPKTPLTLASVVLLDPTFSDFGPFRRNIKKKTS